MPNRPDVSWRNKNPFLVQFVGNPLLTKGRIVQRNFYDSGFNFQIDSILRIRSVQADNIAKCKFTTFLIKLFETLKTVTGIAKYFVRLCYATKLTTQLQKTQFWFHDFYLEIHLIFLSLFNTLLNIASFPCLVRWSLIFYIFSGFILFVQMLLYQFVFNDTGISLASSSDGRISPVWIPFLNSRGVRPNTAWNFRVK